MKLMKLKLISEIFSHHSHVETKILFYEMEKMHCRSISQDIKLLIAVHLIQWNKGKLLNQITGFFLFLATCNCSFSFIHLTLMIISAEFFVVTNENKE